MKNMRIIYILCVSFFSFYTQIISSNPLYKNGKLYIDSIFLSVQEYKRNLDAKKYSINELEKIDSVLLDVFSQEHCENISSCYSDYLESIFYVHKAYPDINSEAFGEFIYRLIFFNLASNHTYINIENKFILDALLGEINIQYGDNLTKLISHLDMFKNIEVMKKLTTNQKDGVNYLLQSLDNLLKSKKYIIESKDGYANLRGAPTVNGNIIFKIKNGEEITYLKQVKNWLYVKTEQGKHGFVYESQLKIKN